MMFECRTLWPPSNGSDGVLREADLNYRVDQYIFDNEIPEDHVVSQDPGRPHCEAAAGDSCRVSKA